MPAAHSHTIEVLENEIGARLDALLAERLGIGRRAVLRLLDRTRVNGHREPKSMRLRSGDRIEILPGTTGEAPEALRVMRSTTGVLVIDKPAGLPTLSLAGQDEDTLAARVAAFDPGCREAGAPLESGLVQRLDTGTSGLILAARNADAWRALREQIAGHELQKTYLCLVAGTLAGDQTIATPIGQHRKSRRRMIALSHEAPPERYRTQVAESRMTVLGRAGNGTFVRVATSTGARHQVRVHLASIGHPIVGDTLYGGPDLSDTYYGGAALADAPGHCLHAESIRWRDPDSGHSEFEELAPPTWWEQAAGGVLPLAPAQP
ncbi:MAG: RluA family pseudouridine synthase [Deltaproteobacteria bacterium]